MIVPPNKTLPELTDAEFQYIKDRFLLDDDRGARHKIDLLLADANILGFKQGTGLIKELV